MKKLFLILLAAVMMFSLAACGEDSKTPSGGTSTPTGGYDKEFAIYVGGTDEWTPFAGKSGVTFANSNKDVLEINDNGAKVEFTGLIVGESVITATVDGQENKALVRVRTMETTINYKYNPPEDNYFILYEEEEDGKSFEFFGSKIGNVYCFGEEKDDSMWRFSVPSGKGFYSYYNGGEWGEAQDDFETEEIGIAPLDAMEDFFVHYFRTSGYADSALSEKLTEYYVGKEKILGIDCWVFDTKGFNGIELKFWIDPSNGCCLKYERYGDESYIYTVTEYNLNYTEWTGKLKP